VQIDFTSEQQAAISRLASEQGTSPEELVRSTALHLLDDLQFRAAVREGIAQADRGMFIDEAEMDARLAQMLRS
jgi:predicted transcriptional regulator